MKRITRWALLWCTALLWGCGTGSHGPAADLSATTGVRLRIAWPAASRVIPADTAKVTLTASGAGLTAPVVAEATRPSDGSAISEVDLQVPVGPDRLFSAIAWDAGDQALATGNTHVADLAVSNDRLELTITMEAVTPINDVAAADTVVTGAQMIRSPDNPAEGRLVLTGLTTEGGFINDLEKDHFSLEQRLPSGQSVPLPLHGFTAPAPAAAPGGDLDLALVIDTSNRMYETLQGLKPSINALLDSLVANGYNLQVAVVSFEAGAVKDTVDLVSDMAQAKATVGGLSSFDSVPNGANSLDALMTAMTDLTWRPGAQHTLLLATTSMVLQALHDDTYTSETLHTVLDALGDDFTLYVAAPAKNDINMDFLVYRGGRADEDPPLEVIDADPYEAETENHPGRKLIVGDPPLAASLHVAGDYDWYHFDTVAGQRYTIRLTPLSDVEPNVKEIQFKFTSQFGFSTFRSSPAPGQPAQFNFEARDDGQTTVYVTQRAGVNQVMRYTIEVFPADEETYWDLDPIPARVLGERARHGGWLDLPEGGNVDLAAFFNTSQGSGDYTISWPLLWVGAALNRDQNLILRINDGTRISKLPLRGQF